MSHDVQLVHTLRDAFGDDIILFDEQHESAAHRIVAEFVHEGRSYAVLQSEAQSKEDEILIFRVATRDGQPELETIEDDEEWETVSEIYDELAFPMQDEW